MYCTLYFVPQVVEYLINIYLLFHVNFWQTKGYWKNRNHNIRLYAHTFSFWQNMMYELFCVYIKYLFCQTHCCTIYENNAIEEDPARIRFFEFKLHCVFEAWSQRTRFWLVKIYIYEIAKNQRLFWTSPSCLESLESSGGVLGLPMLTESQKPSHVL